MGRIRQQYPQNYNSSGNIHTDIENIIRYLNAAEIGNNTIGELFSKLFDENGYFDGPIQFRMNSSTGFEYRIGEYRNAEDGWKLISTIETLRGPAGLNIGQIDGPLFFNKVDYSVTVNGTTHIPYTFDPETTDIMVFKNGILLRKTGVSPDYSYDTVAGDIILTTPVNTGTVISTISIRASAVSNYRRLDYVATSTTAVVPFVFSAEEKLLIFRNGIFQREGGANDYVLSPETDTITYIPPLNSGDVATVLTVENLSQSVVAGLMLEDEYTNSVGLIPYNKLSIENNEIAQAKVQGLSSSLASKPNLTVSNTSPITPASGDLWLDTSQVPNILKFYQGTQWLAASPDKAVPAFTTALANLYLRVNGTGTALEYGAIDFSSLVPKTYMGAANGVASLDSTGKLPTSQLPSIFSAGTMAGYLSGSIANNTYRLNSFYRQKIRIDGISLKLDAGSCSVQLAVDGVAVGSVYAVTTTRLNNTIAPVIEIDGTTYGRVIQLIITNASSANGLDAAISYTTAAT